MGKLIFSFIVFMLGVIAWRLLKRLVRNAEASREVSLARGLTIGSWVSLSLGLFVPALIIFYSTLVVIPAGSVGIATLFGEVQPKPLREGLSIVNPLLDVTKMSVQVQKRPGKYDAASKDLQAVHVEMVLNYRLMPDRAPEVYQKIGVDFATVIVDPAAQEVLKANTALHIASEILHQRPVIKNNVQEGLTTWLAKYGIELQEAALANISFDETYQKAIEAKQIEEQKAAQKTYELIQAQKQAEIKVAEARGQGDATEAKARGEAAATLLRADAEATYNAKVSQSLTAVLIQQQYLLRWNGELPKYMLGQNSGMLLQLPADPGTGAVK